MSGINVVAHNMHAMFSNRELGIVNNRKAKSAEKLSSGYKINRAADDAAGLSISEKMRKMIRGLEQGSENVQDGISLVHVADGAMEEMTSCLDRIYELSVKAYNGTNSRSDREDMQSEINQILDEIERIADTTKYNEIQVLQQKPFHYIETMEHLSNEIPSWLTVSDKISFENSASLQNSTTVQDENKQNNPFYKYLTNEAETFFPYARKRTSTGADDASNNKNESDDLYDFWGSPEAFKNIYGIDPDTTTPDVNDRYQTDKGLVRIVSTFSPGLEDNACASIDFSGLKTAKSGEDLYNKLLDLLGTNVGVPCMTHGASNNQNIYGLSFTGDRYEYASDNSFIRGNGSSLYRNLAVIDLNEVTVNGKNVFDYAKSANNMNIANVADRIAKELCEYSAKEISKECIAGQHFNMAYPDTDYKLIVYDIRDKAFFGNADPRGMSNNQVSTERNAERHFLTKSYDPPFGDFVSYEEGIWIQCSSDNTDGFEIDLPYITNERMGIEGYSIARYNTVATLNEEKSRKAREKASEEYKAEMQEYDREMIEYNKAMAEYNKEYSEYLKEKKAWEEDISHTITTTKTIPYKAAYTTEEPRSREFINDYGETQTENYTETVSHEAVPAHDVTETTHIPFPKAPPTRPTAPTKPVDPTGINIYDYTDVYAPDDFEIISRAKKFVTSIRSHLGAQENRLEHTYRNNRNKEENTQAAESLIRDTDMAKEMVRFSKETILQQAGQSMLAQANQDNQGVLSLLQ